MEQVKHLSQEEFEIWLDEHPEWHEWRDHCRSCFIAQCHHDLWGPEPHMYEDGSCSCVACVYRDDI